MRIFILSMPLIAAMAIFSVRAQQSITYTAQYSTAPLPEFVQIFEKAHRQATAKK